MELFTPGANNGLYAQLHYFLNFSQLLVSCLPLLAKLINSGVLDLSSHGNNNQTHLQCVLNGCDVSTLFSILSES